MKYEKLIEYVWEVARYKNEAMVSAWSKHANYPLNFDSDEL